MTEPTNKECLFACMTLARKDHKGVYIKVTNEELPKQEIILNPAENVAGKKIYYAQAYDEDLKLRTNPNIYITEYGSYTHPSEVFVPVKPKKPKGIPLTNPEE